jgi:hypothetical protein
MDVSDEKFMVFISHKHDDHALAERVKHLIESLNRKAITCFVSGHDITAGADWRREVRGALARSHMLVLLFTAPSKNWDWCLFETGLYTRSDNTDIRAVVPLFHPGQASPSPLADLQGVPAKADKIGEFLDALCRRTWTVSDDWRRGALAPDVRAEKVSEVAKPSRRSSAVQARLRRTIRAIAWSFRCPMTTRLQRASRRARGSWKARTTPRPTPWRCSTWQADPAGACGATCSRPSEEPLRHGVTKSTRSSVRPSMRRSLRRPPVA